jgi:hypothetical protein
MVVRTSRDIYVGQRILVECECRLSGVPTDPTVLQCTVRSPSGTSVTLNYPDVNLTRRDLGFFEANVTVSEGGTWWVRFEAAGVADAVQEISFEVLSSNVM